MIATWMLYATGLSLALGLAALALEQSLRLFNRPGRWVWLVAIAASLIVPLALAVTPRHTPAPVPVEFSAVPSAVTHIATPSAVVAPVAPPAPSLLDRLPALDRPLLIVWGFASLLTALVLVIGHIGLRRDLARWPAERVDDQAVLVSPDLGPAVVGAWRGVVVLPVWARELKSDVRTLIVRHEAEHVAAADALLLLVAAFAVVVCPWNLALWWQRARLGDAVELDCDARVVRSGVDPVAYGALLLDVARRAAGVPKAAIALAAPPSLLSRRIAMLISPAARARVARAVFGVAVGGLLVALACEAPHPLAPVLPAASADARAELPWPILTRTVGSIDYPPLLAEGGVGGTVVLAFDVRRDGSVDPNTIRPLRSSDARFEQLPIPWLLTARFRPSVGAGSVRVQQEFDFAVMGVSPAPVGDEAPVAPPYPIRTNYWPHGVRGDSPQALVQSRWRRSQSSFSFGHMVGGPAPKPGGFTFTTRNAVGGARPSALPQDIRITKKLLEPGNQGTASVDFVAYADGHVDPASIRFTQPAPAALQDAVRQSLVAADFKSAFVGTQATSRVAHQSVRFTTKGVGAAARPDTLETTTNWDRDPGTEQGQGDVVLPKRLASPMPVYPPLLVEAYIQGHVTLEFVVNADGRVDSSTLRVVESSHAQFGMSARRAVTQERFTPASVNGRAVSMKVAQQVHYLFSYRDGYDKPSPVSGQVEPIIVVRQAPPPRMSKGELSFGPGIDSVKWMLAGDGPRSAYAAVPHAILQLAGANLPDSLVAEFTVDSTGHVNLESLRIRAVSWMNDDDRNEVALLILNSRFAVMDGVGKWHAARGHAYPSRMGGRGWGAGIAWLRLDN